MVTRIDTYRLRKAISNEEFDYLTLMSVLSDYQAPRQKVNELLKSGVIVRVKKGLYVFGAEYAQAPICIELLANLIYGPSCISLEYALSYHGLIPERVMTLTCITPKKNKYFCTPMGDFSYRHLHPSKYPHGVDQVWLDRDHPVLMATPEKALCDYTTLNETLIDSPAAARQFLEDDLRIDVSRLDKNAVADLNRHYSSPVIAHLVEAL